MEYVIKTTYLSQLSLSLVLSLSVTRPVFAQVSENYFSNDAEIVVTGTKSEKILADEPVKTEVFTANQIEDFRPTDVSEAMKYIPGISLQGVHGRTGSAPVIQGLGESHTLILVNGVPRPQVSSGGFDLTQLDVANIERIEVVKGASSSLYGSQAMGGVINIITKEPVKKFDANLDLRVGSLSDREGDSSLDSGNTLSTGRVSGVWQEYKYNLYASRRTKENFDLDTSTIIQDGRDQNIQNYTMRLDREKGSHHSYIEYSYMRDRTEDISSAQVVSGDFEKRVNRTDVVAQNTLLSHEVELNDRSSLNFKIQYNRTEDNYDFSDDPETAYSENTILGIYENIWLEGQYHLGLGDYQDLTMGVVTKFDKLNKENTTQTSSDFSLSTTEVDEKKQNSFQAYLQDDIILDNWEVVPGARANYSEGFGMEFTPKVSVRYDLLQGTEVKGNLRASVGRGYRVPDLKERYYLLDHSSLANYRVEGNENLSPETSTSYQLGSQWDFSERVSLYLNFYINEISNLIDYDDGRLEGSTTVYSYQNIGKVQTRGTEFSVKSSLFGGLSHQLSYTYTRAINKNTGKFLTNRPFHIFQNSLIYQMKDGGPSFTLDGVYRDNEYTSADNTSISQGYFQWDAMVNIPVMKKGEFYLGVDNFFNKTREPRSDGQTTLTDNRPALGRYLFFGLNLKV